MDLPTPRLEPGVAPLGQRVVVLGGFDTSQTQGLHITSSTIAYDVASDTCSALPDAPVEWTHANLAGASATVYLLGGATGTSYAPVGDSYAIDLDLADPVWRSIAPQPAGLERAAAGVVVAPPNIILVGGATETAAVATVLSYNITYDEWTELPALPEPLSHPSAMQYDNGTLIVAGGLTTLDSRDASIHTWALPLLATAWEPRADMPVARGGAAGGEIFHQLVLAGGESGQAALSRVDQYNPITNEWSQLPDLPEPRAGTQAAVVGGRLFVPGGARALAFEPEATLFAFSFLDALGDR